jgi:ADP-ribose pyrophosphatase YjhB (NUDIX family)
LLRNPSPALGVTSVNIVNIRGVRDNIAMRRLLDLAYRIRKRLLRIFRRRTRGVKVMLFNGAGELLLIRNSYGRSDLYVLPGGGIRPLETPARAACREVGEELDCLVEEIELISTHSSQAEGKQDTIHLFRAITENRPRPDRFEVEEARFFALDALPANVSPATKRRIEEFLGTRTHDGGW